MESLNSYSQKRELHQLQQMQDKAKESCMASFRILHSFLQVLSYNELKINGCFEWAFVTLFEQDVQTFTCSMLLHLDQLDKDEFQEDRSMAAFWKSVAERTHHKRQYDSMMNERQMQSKEGKVDSSKSLDAIIESSGTESGKHDTSSSLGNYLTHVVDAAIRLLNNQVPSTE
ncbi:hypothetical protein Tco_0756295, partial [Tanacetum coccineum]